MYLNLKKQKGCSLDLSPLSLHENCAFWAMQQAANVMSLVLRRNVRIKSVTIEVGDSFDPWSIPVSEEDKRVESPGATRAELLALLERVRPYVDDYFVGIQDGTDHYKLLGDIDAAIGEPEPMVVQSP